jgi:hypothetical protein
MRPLVSWATGDFVALARHYGVTPETLALVAMQRFEQNPPPSLNLISDYPLTDRPCETCDLLGICHSAQRQNRDACFL